MTDDAVVPAPVCPQALDLEPVRRERLRILAGFDAQPVGVVGTSLLPRERLRILTGFDALVVDILGKPPSFRSLR